MKQGTLVAAPVGVFERIPIEDIDGAAPEDSYVRGLADSIRRVGMLSPILVETNARGQYRVLAGRRRLAAARLAGLDHIDCVVYTSGELNADQVTMIENAMRRSNPLAELDAIRNLIGEGHDEKAIAKMTGMPVNTIRKRLKLARLNPVLRQAVENGDLALGTAEHAATLPQEAQESIVHMLIQFGEGKRQRVTTDDVRALRQVAVESSPEQAALIERLESDDDLPWRAEVAGWLRAAAANAKDAALRDEIAALIAKVEAS